MLISDPAAVLKTPVSLAHLTQDAYDTARSKGWPSHMGDGIPVALLLIHAEISKSEEAQGQSAYVGKLADVIIRCLDLAVCLHERTWYAALAELLQGESPYLCTLEMLARLQTATPLDPAPLGIRLHLHVSRLTRLFRRTPEHSDDMPPTFFMELALLVRLTAKAIMHCGEAPDLVVQSVLLRNKSRPVNHGGKRI